ncbi:MAG: bifunctional chorismate mutase/prephenate dehydrogenase [Xanthomonadales bacterium]|nr:T-protein [Xanthomonadales bacterium]MCC6592637.1 bifunctional chorismate mutase/prephenate dehydrogenase [Xanthomonadales bacterium]MCE7931778.1 bifunctional chorismate mutase/prephenate dehydrogenase [Xanthomonadales bacterium PRO6]
MRPLSELRAELDAVDAELIAAIAHRQALVAEIGRWKHAQGRQLRDFQREREVIANVRAKAQAIGLDGEIAEQVMKLLIESSLTTQEQDRVRLASQGGGRRALVIGGNGRMGRWFVRFLAAQGFDVEVADPSGAPEGSVGRANWSEGALDQDLIVVAAPMRRSNEILLALAERRPAGLVFDIGSLKTPLIEGLTACAAAGLRVCSVHPMFGPDTELLSDRHVIFLPVGAPDAVCQARELFAQTMVQAVEMSLAEHDHLIAYVLGLSHALNIVFFTALANSGEAAPKLARMSSTTFDRQLRIATGVASENPRMYYEIQSLNAFRGEALDALRRAVGELTRCIEEGDEIGFVALMERGRGYLSARALPRG